MWRVTTYGSPTEGCPRQCLNTEFTVHERQDGDFSKNLVNNSSWSLKVAMLGCLKLPIEYAWELLGLHPVAHPAHTAIPDTAGDTEEKPVSFQRAEVLVEN